nr:SDR family NAD(P)-dependent oxidoreductase [Curtobacterium sp. 1310]
MTGTLQGETALVTGGTSGIGLAVVRRFVAEGAHIFVTGRRREALDAVRDEFGDAVTPIRADAAQPTDIATVFAGTPSPADHRYENVLTHRRDSKRARRCLSPPFGPGVSRPSRGCRSRLQCAASGCAAAKRPGTPSRRRRDCTGAHGQDPRSAARVPQGRLVEPLSPEGRYTGLRTERRR